MATKMEIKKDEGLDYAIEHIKKYAESAESIADKYTVKTLVRLANHLFLNHKGNQKDLSERVFNKLKK